MLEDISNNKNKIIELNKDVNLVSNQLELGITFLKIINKYLELLSDVARNSGHVWVFIANDHANKIEEYENTLRESADNFDNKDEILKELDETLSELETARINIDNAEKTYAMVKLPGTPLIKFAEGNSYLRASKANLISAQMHLHNAFNLMR